jgi:hypothetical protein
VQGKRIGNIALSGTERARNGGGDAATHAARGRVLDQHHKGESKRRTREHVGAKTAKK